MSRTWVVVPTCCNYNDNYNVPGLAAELLRIPGLRRRYLGVSGRSDRPAWQSPYGPPSHRARRGRWAPVPGVANPRSTLPREYLCGRCD